jgi:hypothetical protein
VHVKFELVSMLPPTESSQIPDAIAALKERKAHFTSLNKRVMDRRNGKPEEEKEKEKDVVSVEDTPEDTGMDAQEENDTSDTADEITNVEETAEETVDGTVDGVVAMLKNALSDA